jgi:TPR repeat protein
MRKLVDPRASPNEPDPAELYDAYHALKLGSEGGLARLESLADRGSMNSMLYIADAYRLGEGVSADFVKAEHWYRRAAELDSVIANDVLGRIWLKAGLTDNAIAAFSKAAERGYAPAIYALGRIYLSGVGVAIDEQRAISLLEQAMALGSLHAKGALAKYLVMRHKSISSVIRGYWLGLTCRIEFVFVLLTQGLKSDRFK